MGVYTAAAETLSHFEKPVLFDELVCELERATGERPPEYSLRTCLRCWLAHDLIIRKARRYSPTRSVKTQTFKSAAMRLWRRLEKATPTTD